MPNERRPLGVTLLSILHVVLGALLLLGGLTLVLMGSVLPRVLSEMRALAAISRISGLLVLVFALVDFGLAYGLWTGKRWAWFLALALAVLGIIISILGLFATPRLGEFISLVLDLIILYYLIQPRVQGYFGKEMLSFTRG